MSFAARLVKVLGLLLAVVLAAPAFAEDLVPLAPGAVLMDFASGRLLFQKNPEWTDPPASLTKLMTLHLAWKALEAGEIKANTPVPVLAQVLALVPPARR